MCVFFFVATAIYFICQTSYIFNLITTLINIFPFSWNVVHREVFSYKKAKVKSIRGRSWLWFYVWIKRFVCYPSKSRTKSVWQTIVLYKSILKWFKCYKSICTCKFQTNKMVVEEESVHKSSWYIKNEWHVIQSTNKCGNVSIE